MDKDNNGFYNVVIFNGETSKAGYHYPGLAEKLKEHLSKGSVPVYLHQSGTGYSPKPDSSKLCGELRSLDFNEADKLIMAHFKPFGPQGQFADMVLDMGKPTFGIRGQGKKRKDGKMELDRLISIDFLPG